MGSHQKHQAGHTPTVHEHADDWHHHAAAEGVPQAEHTGAASSSAIAKWMAAITVTVIAVIILLVMYAGRVTTRYRAERMERQGWLVLNSGARHAKATAQSMLTTPGPSGEKAYRIPIDTAIDKVVAAYQAAPKPKPADRP